MKKITLTVDEELIDAAQHKAAVEGTTLEALFQRWLYDYVERGRQTDRAMAVIRELQEMIDTSGRKFTRNEMNER